MRVYPNQAVRVSQSITTETVRDEFNALSYSNNDGTAEWTSNWIETGDNGSPIGGEIWIADGKNLLMRRSNRMIHRFVNLPTGSEVWLEFEFKRVGFLDASHFIALEVSTDGGGSWTELARFSGPANDS